MDAGAWGAYRTTISLTSLRSVEASATESAALDTEELHEAKSTTVNAAPSSGVASIGFMEGLSNETHARWWSRVRIVLAMSGHRWHRRLIVIMNRSHCQQTVNIEKASCEVWDLRSSNHHMIGVDVSQQTDRMITLLSYLASKPTLDDVAQFLVLDIFREHKPRAALISVFDSSGNVTAAGSFGLASEVVRALRRMSLWDRSPAVDAIRDGEPLILNDRDSLLGQYPWLENHDGLLNPTMVWPLTLGTQRLGSLQMQFADPVSRDAVAPVFKATAPILGLYVSLRSTSVTPAEPERPHATPRSGNGQVEAELSPRQVRILHLLAEGLTNPQIAARIGFSDSTVRQETMAIYRYLGADGRREAVHIAGLRGLLNEQARPNGVRTATNQPALTGHGQHPSVWSPTAESSFG